MFELHDGSGVVVTVGKYVTPNHVDINGNGLQPDFLKKPGTVLFFIFSGVYSRMMYNLCPADWNEVTERLASCRLHNS